MKTALFSALLVLSSVITLGLTAKQEASNAIDQIRSEEMVAPGGNGGKDKSLEPITEGEEEGGAELLSTRIEHQV